MRGWGERLFERGRERGLKQGRAKGLEEGLEKGLEKGLARGVTRGRAESILRLLTARGVPVDEAARQRILGCTDMATLDRWFDRALNATTLSAVLDSPPQ